MATRSWGWPRAIEGTRERRRHDTAPYAIGSLAAALLSSVALGATAPSDEEVVQSVVAVVEAACRIEDEGAMPLAAALGGAIELAREPIEVRGRAVGWRHELMRRDGVRVRVERFALDGELRRVVASWADPERFARRPRVVAVADGRCRVVTGRRLSYYPDGSARAVEQLDRRLLNVVASEPLNPPVPPGEDPRGVRVALVDSGVNYLHAPLHARLARDDDGTILGFDYWDMDARPFDANPARSQFYPQRHGTRTASLLLAEAPIVSLVPYRYPRDAMHRMTALVEAASGAGAVIVNMSLGSNRREEWRAFEAAARVHPEMLFVVSAGNDGRDIDTEPVWPASLDLENMLVVTSSDASGLPARGSNWGRRSVDVAVPAEGLLATDFDGSPRAVSGSSYAAIRISAMAACIASEHPGWTAPELKAAILARARVPVNAQYAYVAHGVIPDPTEVGRGDCPPAPALIVSAPATRWGAEDLYAEGTLPAHTHVLRPTFVGLSGSGWDPIDVWRAAREMARHLAACGVAIPEATLSWIEAPRRFRQLRDGWSDELARRLAPRKPAAFFVEDTAQAEAFDAEAFGRSNARNRRPLFETVWITRAIPHPGIGLAHEMVHAISDSGTHVDDPENLMHERTSGRNTKLEDWQCKRLVQVGEAFGTLEPVGAN